MKKKLNGHTNMAQKHKLNSGQIITNVHPKKACRGEYCCIHNPSKHHMSDWMQVWRDDKGAMERICKHGIGHPDPDDPYYAKGVNGMHGCDGCCTPPKKKK